MGKLQKRVLSALVLVPGAFIFLYLGGLYLAVLMIAEYAVCLYEWWNMAKRTKSFLLDMLFGVIYISVSFLSFHVLREWLDNGAFFAITLVFAVAASDSGAFLAGSLFGGPKMAPVLSPKKTWSGFGGAVFFGGLMFLIALALVKFIPDGFDPGVSDFVCYFIVGLVIGGTGQAGDLLVSSMKRRSGVKDTGNIIPGHGGIMDRIDSLMLACPVFLIIQFLLQG